MSSSLHKSVLLFTTFSFVKVCLVVILLLAAEKNYFTVQTQEMLFMISDHDAKYSQENTMSNYFRKTFRFLISLVSKLEVQGHYRLKCFAVALYF